MRTAFLLSVWALLHSSGWAQPLSQSADYTSFRPTTVRRSAERTHISVESDPAFWVGTVGNGPASDANLNFRLASAPRWRFGLLRYTGTWTGSYARTLLLTPDFPKANWQVL
ncbi:hypothetical protein ACS5NO_14565 [Larkinella sp. GY13]|uniref:hypothetical protein n=1 Tax=Larkinella sp. GY13 TaxID=3453720 RepID=UPI003EEA7690